MTRVCVELYRGSTGPVAGTALEEWDTRPTRLGPDVWEWLQMRGYGPDDPDLWVNIVGEGEWTPNGVAIDEIWTEVDIPPGPHDDVPAQNVTPVDVINVRRGDPRFEEVIGHIRQDERLLREMWADAEHRLDDDSLSRHWTVVVVREGGQRVPAAWCTSRVEWQHGTRVLVCADNYERRGAGRDNKLYDLAYAHRHATIVTPWPGPAVTYLFDGPIALHEADGWRRTGLTGTSRQDGIPPHEWHELRRPCLACAPIVYSP